VARHILHTVPQRAIVWPVMGTAVVTSMGVWDLVPVVVGLMEEARIKHILNVKAWRENPWTH